MRLPSEISFTSFLQYSPRGISEICKQSRALRDAIKHDGVLFVKQPGNESKAVRGIELVVAWLAKKREEFPFLQQIFNPERTLIPIPRSAPLRQRDALWPTRRICDALVAANLGATVVPALIRHAAVQKSATAPAGQRPGPLDHLNSTKIDPNSPILLENGITLVDDFITRGATLLGMYPHVRCAFPNSDICCFAVVRTMSFQEIDTIIAPIQGTVKNYGGRASRSP